MMLKEHPEWWIRATALNMSIHNPQYLKAKMAWPDPLMATIKSRVDLSYDNRCMDSCGGLSTEPHFEYKYQLILEGETAPW